MTVLGILLVDKPVGMSSHAAVAVTRRAYGTKKVGHAGTLDPAASGLLVLGLGGGTRLLTFLVGLDKTYEATVRLGVSTTTDDADGEVTAAPGCPAEADVAGVLGEFIGVISQRPSSVSAVKVGGRRAYDRVRAGEDVVLPEREVTVHDLALLGVEQGSADTVRVLDVRLRADVSSGTYIRALARDIGLRLGTAGHVTALRRTAVGPFTVTNAVALAELTGREPLLALGEVAQQVLPVVVVTGGQERAVRHGQRIATATDTAELPAALVNATGDLLAVARPDGENWRYLMVLPE